MEDGLKIEKNGSRAVRQISPLPLWERVMPSEARHRERGEDVAGTNPSPGSPLLRLATLSHKGRGEEPRVVISANPYVLQELAKEPGTREHEIISAQRRYLAKPHGYPLSGQDGAGRRVLFHSGEKEKFGAG